MKLNKILTITIILASAFAISCANKGSNENAQAEAEQSQTGPEYTSAYVCPMHCEGSGSAEPGNCPVCKMDYVPNENYKAPETATTFACSMHPEVTGASGDSCRICKMALTPVNNPAETIMEGHEGHDHAH
jgi:hypothetical protein